jgi:hypothetical protein
MIIMSGSSEIKTPILEYKPPVELIASRFVDIINTNNIFKVGYSGTINVKLPPISSEIKFNQSDIFIDEDENTNVKYAILESSIINGSKLIDKSDKNDLIDLLIKDELLNSYDALIDTYGLFKNIKNQDIAQSLYDNLNKRTQHEFTLMESEEQEKKKKRINKKEPIIVE